MAGGVPGKPERRVTQTLRAAAGGAVLQFEETWRAGAYRVLLEGEAGPVAVFGAQQDPEESDVADLTPGQRAEVERVGQVIDWEPGLDVRAAFDRERYGVELWLVLAVAVLVLAVVEGWLAQQFSRPK